MKNAYCAKHPGERRTLSPKSAEQKRADFVERCKQAVKTLLLLLRSMWHYLLRGLVFVIFDVDAPHVHTVMTQFTKEEVMHRINYGVPCGVPVRKTKELRPTKTMLLERSLSIMAGLCVTPLLRNTNVLLPAPRGPWAGKVVDIRPFQQAE